MSKPDIKLYTMEEDLAVLHTINAKTKRTSLSVTIPREALMRLLMDHANICHLIQKSGGYYAQKVAVND